MESLYRKYRPKTFGDVVGQTHVVETLEHAVLEGRTSHAYLFCGPRGTGKTTMARILAKALLCDRGPGALPDGTCEQCELIAAGEHPDVYELDAASRTGVDNVREEIINRVGYAPSRGRYKVYIIDEVHMLTPAAFNALLKTLEEPPAHVVFVMCTTDPQKILSTILSRVQRFDFHAIGSEDMLRHLEHVCESEGFTYEEQALELVVRHARGGMRDALSTLEQLSVFGSGSIDVASAQDLLGEVPGSELQDVAAAMAGRDVATLFECVGRLVDEGRDLLQFARELSAHLRDVYVVAAVGARPGVVRASEEELASLRSEAEAFGSHDRVSRALTILGDASTEMRVATNQRLALEIAFAKIARPESEVTLESLAERIDALERQVAQLCVPGAVRTSAQVQDTPPARGPVVVASDPTPVATATTQGSPRSPEPAPAPRASKPLDPPARAASAEPRREAAPVKAVDSPAAEATSPTDDAALQRKWKQVVDTLVKTAASRGSLLMSSTAVSDNGTELRVSLPKGSSFSLKMLERQDVRSIIVPVVEQVFGHRALSFFEAAGDPAGPKPSRVHRQPTTESRRAEPISRSAAPAPSSPAQSGPKNRPEPERRSRGPVETKPSTGFDAPWEERDPEPMAAAVPPPYDPVPYDEADAAPYVPPADETPSPVDRPQQQASGGTGERADKVVSQPALAPVEATTEAAAGVRTYPDELPQDLKEVLDDAFEVFGNGVKLNAFRSSREAVADEVAASEMTDFGTGSADSYDDAEPDGLDGSDDFDEDE